MEDLGKIIAAFVFIVVIFLVILLFVLYPPTSNNPSDFLTGIISSTRDALNWVSDVFYSVVNWFSKLFSQS